MKKLRSITLCLLLSLFACTAFAAKNEKFVTYNFSGVTLDVGSNVDWPFYNLWDVAFSFKVNGAISPGWNGVQIQSLTTTPFIYPLGFDGDSMQVLAIGLTNNNGGSFTPNPAPSTCLVSMKDGDTLYVSGILHVPGNYAKPYFENLNCKLN